MEHKKSKLFKLALLPVVFSIFVTLFTSCLTVHYNEASDEEAPTVMEEVVETEEAADDDDDE